MFDLIKELTELPGPVGQEGAVVDRVEARWREADIAEIKRRLREQPTAILGVGGLGKSRLAAEIDAALIGTMESCAFTLGPEVAQLEKDFAPYAGTTYAAGVNNGRNALYLPLLAAGIGPGDEVITVPFTFSE